MTDSERDEALRLAKEAGMQFYGRTEFGTDTWVCAEEHIQRLIEFARAQPQGEPVGEIYDFNIMTEYPTARFKEEWHKKLKVEDLPIALYTAPAIPPGWRLVRDDDLLDIARRIEDLKQPCGMNPESPMAMRNGQYMNIAYRVRAMLAAAPKPAIAWPFASEPPKPGGE